MTPTLTLTMHRADSNPNYVPKFGQPAMEQGSGDSCLPARNQGSFGLTHGSGRATDNIGKTWEV